MKKVFFTALFVCFITSISAQSKTTKAQTKKEKAKRMYGQTKALISSGAFEFTGTWAFPLGGGRINLIGNPNNLEIKKDSVQAFLPYFGVIQAGGVDYRGQGGIRFDDRMENYLVDFNDAKKRITITFNARSKKENFQVVLTIHKNRNASLVATGLYRNAIRYNGEISKTISDEIEGR